MSIRNNKNSQHTHMIHKRKIATIKHTYKDFDLLCLYINVPLTESHTKFMSLMYDKVLASMFFMMASTTHNDAESEGKEKSTDLGGKVSSLERKKEKKEKLYQTSTTKRQKQILLHKFHFLMS